MKRKLEPYLYILPYFLLFTLFLIVPGVFGIIMSLFRWEVVGLRKFIGFQNYVELFQDISFSRSLRNLSLYTLLYVPSFISIGLLLAILLNNNFLFRNVFRVLIFAPYIFMYAAVGVMWRWLMDTNFGILNYYLSHLGIAKIGWLTNPKIALVSIYITILWETSGYSMILYLAALQTIPRELYESANMDGAASWTTFWRITLPQLQPTTFYLMIIGFIGGFKTFAQPYMMTKGGPVDSTLTLVMYLYNTGFSYFRLGYAASISTILFLIILLMTVFQFRTIRQRFD
jgi:ABC-type sugar transport system permease subunit